MENLDRLLQLLELSEENENNKIRIKILKHFERQSQSIIPKPNLDIDYILNLLNKCILQFGCSRNYVYYYSHMCIEGKLNKDNWFLNESFCFTHTFKVEGSIYLNNEILIDEYVLNSIFVVKNFMLKTIILKEDSIIRMDGSEEDQILIKKFFSQIRYNGYLT